MTSLLEWRRAENSRALWWRGARVMLVQISFGLRQTSQWFDTEGAALAALQSERIEWSSVSAPRVFEGGA